MCCGILRDIPHCGVGVRFKGKPIQKHEFKSVIWIDVVIDITDESAAEQIIHHTVRLLHSTQQE